MKIQLSRIVVSLEYTDVPEVRTASIIRAMNTIALVEEVRTSETSVYFNESTRRYIPESSNLPNNT
jgi:hypothetical protein